MKKQLFLFFTALIAVNALIIGQDFARKSWAKEKWLKESAIVISNRTIISSRGLVTFWFDDGWKTMYTKAFPIMKQYNFIGVNSVATKLAGKSGYITWKEARVLQKEGWETVSHGISHIPLTQLSLGEVKKELKESKRNLALQGLNNNHFVLPEGLFNPKIRQEIKRAGYESMRTTQQGLNSLPALPYDLRVQEVRYSTPLKEVRGWINKAQKENKWLILLFHKVGKEREPYSIPPEKFGKIVKYVAQLEMPVVNATEGLKARTRGVEN